jgi:hypothetical protein
MGAVGAWLMPTNTLYVFVLSCGIVAAILLAAFVWAMATGKVGEMRKAARDARSGKGNPKGKKGLGGASWYQVVPYGVSVSVATWLLLAFYLVQNKSFPFL